MASERALRSRRPVDLLRRIDVRQAGDLGTIAATVATCLLIVVLRRPDQLRHPYVWVEEYLIINRYQDFGPVNASLHPYVGYFLWPTSFSVSLATYLSFEHLPEVAYLLNTMWLVATVLLIVVPASFVGLRWRAGLAVLLVLAPADPEVFGVLLYVFWWTSLWPLITLLWSRDHWVLRTVVLVIGGMSSVAGALLVVPYALSFLLSRRRRDLWSTLVLTACLVPQLIAYLSSPRAEAGIEGADVALQVLRNLGFYVLLWLPSAQLSFLAFAGALILVGLALAAARRATVPTPRLDVAVFALAALLVQVASSVPAPLLTHPLLAGPRYYFLPFAVTSWVLLLVVATSAVPRARVAATVVLGLGVLSLSQGFSRGHDPVDWSRQLDRCRTEEAPFFVPVHFTGVEAEMWGEQLVMSPAMCERFDR